MRIKSWQAHRWRIDLSVVPEEFRHRDLMKVTLLSHDRLIREVERFAYYFRREFNYDFAQFSEGDTTDYTAYLFQSSELLDPIWVGACCFRASHHYSNIPEAQLLDWVWIHPYFRDKGLLTEHWATFRANHGDFFAGEPLSTTMRHFLIKHNSDSMWMPHYIRGRQSFGQKPITELA